MATTGKLQANGVSGKGTTCLLTTGKGGAADSCICSGECFVPARYCSDDTFVYLTGDDENTYRAGINFGCADDHTSVVTVYTCLFDDSVGGLHPENTWCGCIYYDYSTTESPVPADGFLVGVDAIQLNGFTLGVDSCNYGVCDADGDGNPDPPGTPPTDEPCAPGDNLDCCGVASDTLYLVTFSGFPDPTTCCNYGGAFTAQPTTYWNNTFFVPFAGPCDSCGSISFTVPLAYTSYSPDCAGATTPASDNYTLSVQFTGGQWLVSILAGNPINTMFTAPAFGDCDGGSAANTHPCFPLSRVSISKHPIFDPLFP